MINRITLMGRLGADPELRSLQSGDNVANFTLATSESWTDKNTHEKKERTEWHRVTIFGHLADVAQKYLRKGARVYLEGQSRTRKWTDQSGQDRYTTEAVLSGPGAVMRIIDFPDDAGAPPQSARDGAGGSDVDDEIPF